MHFAVQLFIDGCWTGSTTGSTIPVVNPATGESIGTVASAGKEDLDVALEAAERGFHHWRRISSFERSRIMRKAADLLRHRADTIAHTITLEEGKPLNEARGEV